MTKTRLQSKPRSHAAKTDLIVHIRERVPFTTSGSLSAQTVGSSGFRVSQCGVWRAGRLKGADLNTFHEHNNAFQIDYVVLSYSTPIAWHSPKFGWHVVEQKFSTTTSAQQSIVRQAVGQEARNGKQDFFEYKVDLSF